MSIDTDRLPTARGTFGLRRRPSSGGKRVLCIHGFPDDASTFDALAGRLSGEGYEVVSMYLRGYSPSVLDGPYDLALMVEDVVAVLDALGWRDSVRLVGHDYGAQIGFAALSQQPARFSAAVMLAGAHPSAIARNTRRHPRQIWLSRYIVFFQLGRLAERRVARNSFAYIDRLWRRWSPGWAGDPAHLARVKATIASSMPAPVAMYRGGGFDIGAGLIPVPTLFIAGADDGCVLPAMSEGQERLFSASYEREVWQDTGHFPQLEKPERTAEAVLRWFAHR